MIGGALAVVIWARYRNFLGLTLLDLTAPALALGYAVGRCGCQLSGDGDYGKPWNGPWAMAYPHGTLPTDRTVQPTPVYETLAMGLGAWLLWQMRDRFRPGSSSPSTCSTRVPSGSWSSSFAATRWSRWGSPRRNSRAWR